MVSALIQAGVPTYFSRIAILDLPSHKHPQYHVIQRKKRDAVTGILRCFEQMTFQDFRFVNLEVFERLTELAWDVDQPFTVQSLARTALGTSES